MESAPPGIEDEEGEDMTEQQSKLDYEVNSIVI